MTNDRRLDSQELHALAARVLRQESAALAALERQLDLEAVQRAVAMILDCQGLVMVVGAGTSSSLAHRLAHMLTCSGVRAIYLDAGEAQHGYSAIISGRDLLIAFSRGGESDEVNFVLRLAQKRGAGRIGITERPDSTLGQLCDIRLHARVAPAHNAGGVIPLASTLAHAAVGDVLCAAVLAFYGLDERRFAELHPGGAVGKRLGQRAADGEDRGAAKDLSAPSDPADLGALQGLVLDMDGVLWHGDKPLPGLIELFDVLRRRNIQYVLATNNPSQRPEGFVQKARRMGVELDPQLVINSGLATIYYLKTRYAPGSRIHVIGEKPLKEMVEAAGYVLANDDVAAVVVALDRSMTYETIERGTILIRGGAEFIGTNADPFYPTERGILPGSGTVVATLMASTGSVPTIIGKPERWMLDFALARMALKPHQVASVGDRLDTDIEGGQRAGMKTILVLSGIATRESLAESPIRPTWVFSGIDELARALDEAA